MDRLWSVDDIQVDRRRYLQRKVERGRLSRDEVEMLELLPRLMGSHWDGQENAGGSGYGSMYAGVSEVSSEVEMDLLNRYLELDSYENEQCSTGTTMRCWSKVKRLCSKLLPLRFRRRRPADLESQYNS